MREIKFRAWDGESMVYDFIIVEHRPSLEVMGIKVSEYYAPSVRMCKAASVMQYTGLKDKTATEIYEGDIVNIPYNYIGRQVVEFIDGAFSVSGYNLANCVIIGNIHENPELLDG